MIPTLRRTPARTRLTLWYVLLLVGSLLGLGSVGLWVLEGTLTASTDELLRSKAAAVAGEIDTLEGDGGAAAGQLTFQPGSPDVAAAVVGGLDVVRIWDRERRPAYAHEGAPGFPLTSPSSFASALAGASTYRTERAADGTGVRLYAEAVRANDQILGVLEVGRSEAATDALLFRLRLLGAGGLFAALVLGWAGGQVLAARALAPVDRITRAAERIGHEDLSRRLALPPADDEFGRLVAAFNGMIERLDRAFQRERRFTADASHELRTPLTIIHAQTEVALRRPRDPADDMQTLSSIREESERLQRLLENLLLLARADAGQPLELEPVDLQEVVAEVSARIGPRARQQGLHFVVRVDEVGPVQGDTTWLAQLLVNLLDNALRHTPRGGQVSLSLEAVRHGSRLEVADTGEGIAAEHLPRLFERFYRVDHARTRVAGGAGLGLAICDWVARAHGGRLDVESRPGQGTIFRLWLPGATRPPVTTTA